MQFISHQITNDRPAIVIPKSYQSRPLASKTEPARNSLIAACFTTNCKAFHWDLSCSQQNMETLLFIIVGIVVMVGSHLLARLFMKQDLERAKRQGYRVASAMISHETNR
jgi:hypothetical protein